MAVSKGVPRSTEESTRWARVSATSPGTKESRRRTFGTIRKSSGLKSGQKGVRACFFDREESQGAAYVMDLDLVAFELRNREEEKEESEVQPAISPSFASSKESSPDLGKFWPSPSLIVSIETLIDSSVWWANRRRKTWSRKKWWKMIDDSPHCSCCRWKSSARDWRSDESREHGKVSRGYEQESEELECKRTFLSSPPSNHSPMSPSPAPESSKPKSTTQAHKPPNVFSKSVSWFSPLQADESNSPTLRKTVMGRSWTDSRRTPHLR